MGLRLSPPQLRQENRRSIHVRLYQPRTKHTATALARTSCEGEQAALLQGGRRDRDGHKLTALDPLSPIIVNAEGQAKLPPKPLIATILLDRLKDDRLSYFSVGYSMDKGRITRLRLYDRPTDDEAFWWLTVFTALNLEAEGRQGSRQRAALRRSRKNPNHSSSHGSALGPQSEAVR